MKFGSFKNTAVATTVLVAGLGINSVSFAGDDLTPQDAFVTTMIDKSLVSGNIRPCGTTEGADCMQAFELDSNGNLLFDYHGDVYSVETDAVTAELKEMKNIVGTIDGTAAFPPAFAMMAMGMIPPPTVIEWTCNSCKMVVNGVEYKSIVDEAGDFNAADVEALRMKGRAFTGFGPVEMGMISPGSMSVRMAGCSAVTGADKIGTLCLNGTFTFDMAKLSIGELTGTGTSNCITVLQPKMQ